LLTTNFGLLGEKIALWYECLCKTAGQFKSCFDQCRDSPNYAGHIQIYAAEELSYCNAAAKPASPSSSPIPKKPNSAAGTPATPSSQAGPEVAKGNTEPSKPVPNESASKQATLGNTAGISAPYSIGLSLLLAVVGSFFL
jgi:hypothetical protein